MNKRTSLLIVLAALSCLSGYFLSKMSWIGKAGVRFFYKEYNFLRTWWKGALVVYAILLALYFIHQLLHKRATHSTSKTFHIIALLCAAAGLILTYNDFRDTLSHRWMGERFHIGAYFFWLGWMTISGYFLLNRRNIGPINSGSKGPIA